MTKSYEDIMSEIETLKKQAAATRKKEISAVVSEIKKKIRQYALTAEDLGLVPAKKPARAKTGARKATAKTARKKTAKPVAPKYLDPATGATWTGRGKAPRWIVDAEKAGKKREQFLIK